MREGEHAQRENIWIAVGGALLSLMIIESAGGLAGLLHMSEGVEASRRGVEMMRMDDPTDQLESS